MQQCKKCSTKIKRLDVIRSSVLNKPYICPECKTKYELSFPGKMVVAFSAIVPLILDIHIAAKVVLIIAFPVILMLLLSAINMNFKKDK